MSRAAERARACFRLAADQGTTQGERDAAKARGMAILERNGLDPDHFDIPGRERPRVSNPFADGIPVFTFDDIVREAAQETLRRRADKMRQQMREAMERQAFYGDQAADAFRHMAEGMKAAQEDGPKPNQRLCNQCQKWVGMSETCDRCSA